MHTIKEQRQTVFYNINFLIFTHLDIDENKHLKHSNELPQTSTVLLCCQSDRCKTGEWMIAFRRHIYKAGVARDFMNSVTAQTKSKIKFKDKISSCP